MWRAREDPGGKGWRVYDVSTGTYYQRKERPFSGKTDARRWADEMNGLLRDAAEGMRQGGRR